MKNDNYLPECKFLTAIVLFLFLFSALSAQVSQVSYPVSVMPDQLQQPPDSLFLQLKDKAETSRKNGDYVTEARSLQEMSVLLYHLGNYSQAMEHLFASEKILDIHKDPDLLAANFNLFGTLYYYNQQPAEAGKQFRKALKIFLETKNSSGISETYGLIGHMLEKQRQYDSAYHYQLKALSFAIIAHDTLNVARTHENIGSIFEDKEMFDSARYYFSKALSEYRLLNRLVEQIEVINNLGDVMSKTGNYQMGQEYAKEAARIALITGEKYQLQSAYRDIAQNFKGLGQFDSAYVYLEKSRQLVQSIYAMENGYRISLMQTIYDTGKKESEIAQLNADKRANRVISLAIIACLILVSCLAALVINRQKLKIRTAHALNEGNSRIFETEKGLMESELKRQQLEEASLKQQLDIKSTELSSHILHLVQKNEVMEELKQGLIEIIKDDKRDQKKQIRQLLQKINISFTSDGYWEEFRRIFDQVHPSFLTNIQQLCPGLTPAELRLVSLVKMNLNSADMSTLLGITMDSLRVIRYRVKKKLQIGPDASLSGFVQSL